MSATGGNDVPSQDELDQMSKEELVKLGTNLDGVEIIHRAERFPEPGTGVEKRAERQVAAWFTLAGISALACFIIFIWN
ncbi:menaquinol-cytochrome C reductase, partial [Streptomyces sp. SID10244]|nr:menaquinol-cytochrome C reductase [Streptomyces sp. SID10244]